MNDFGKFLESVSKKTNIKKAQENNNLLEWSVFYNKYDTYPKNQKGPLEHFVAQIYKGFAFREKHTHSICGGTFEGSKLDDNVVSVNFIGFDFDDSNIEELQRLSETFLPGNTIVLCSSPSDGQVVDLYKYRVWVPLSKPIKMTGPKDHHFVVLWEELKEEIERASGGFIDAGCKNPSRSFFTPRILQEKVRRQFVFVRSGDSFFDAFEPEILAKALLRKEKLEKEREERRLKREALLQKYQNKGFYSLTHAEEVIEKRLRKYLQSLCLDIECQGDGDRNNALYCAAYTMGGYLEAGFLEESIVKMSLESAALSTGLESNEIKATIRSGIGAGKARPFDRQEMIAEQLDWLQEKQRERQERFEKEKQQRKLGEEIEEIEVEVFEEETPYYDWSNDEGEPPAPPEDGGPLDGGWDGSDREEILLTGDFREKADQLLEALSRINDESPFIYSISDQFGYVRYRREFSNINGHSVVRHYGSADLYEHGDEFLFQILNKVRLFKVIPSGATIADNSPNQRFFNGLVRSHLVREYPFPVLDGVYRCPFVKRDLTGIAKEKGYYESSRLFLDTDYDIEITEYPTPEDVEICVNWIFDELFHDFPFDDSDDDSSKIHALCMLMLPFVRPLISGPTPLHMIMAPEAGTGKTLLGKVVSYAAYGLHPYIIEEQQSDEEWGKKITSTLIGDDATFVIIDNINKYLDSANVAKLLTDTTWHGRILGQSRNVDKKNLAVWVATANNPKMTKEIERRCLYIKLNSKEQHPEERVAFKHANLEQWIKQHRNDVLKRIMMVLQYWIQQGAPKQRDRVMGSYEEWSAIMGGILQTIGLFEPFLANKDKYREKVDSKTKEWEYFFEIIFSKFGEVPLRVTELFDLINNPEEIPEDLLLGFKGTERERAKKMRQFSGALRDLDGRIINGYEVSVKKVKGYSVLSLKNMNNV